MQFADSTLRLASSVNYVTEGNKKLKDIAKYSPALLMEAVGAGNAEMLEERLREGGVIDWDARRSHTHYYGVFVYPPYCMLPPLHHAVAHYHAAVVKLLLGAGVEVDEAEPDEDGWTPLHFAAAAEYGHLDIAEDLLQAGADVSAVSKAGWTPLHFAAEYGQSHLAIAELLLQAGADVSAADENGDTPLHLAALSGHLERNDIGELLLQAGSDVNAVDRYGLTPLDKAIAYGNLALVKLLCSYGATRTGEEVKDGFGGEGEQTFETHPEIAAWLTSTADYTTALHYILPPNDLVPPRRARALLRAGADIRAARTEDGPTPLHLARQLEAEGNAPDGSTARLILRAAGSWTRETHELFPAERRAEACSLVVSIGHLHARRCVKTGYPERVDFSALVLKHAITR